MITVSVIIPVFNGGLTLRECLDSVLRQTIEGMEVICIDNGSTDSSKAIIQQYAAQDPRLQLLEQENLGGPAWARNRGIQAAQGEYLAFMDADDLYPSPQTLQTLYQTAKEQGVNICGGSFGEFRATIKDTGKPKRIITHWDDPHAAGYTFAAPGLINYADYQFDFGWTRFIYNRAFLLEHHITQPQFRYFEDPPFLVQALSAAQRFYAIPQITYLYRWTPGKLHRLSTPQTALDALAAVEHNIRFAHSHGYQTLFDISVHRLCKILELITTNDLGVVARQLKILSLLQSLPNAAAQAQRLSQQLQWQFIDEKNMLNALRLTRLSLFLKRLKRFIKRHLGMPQ